MYISPYLYVYIVFYANAPLPYATPSSNTRLHAQPVSFAALPGATPCRTEARLFFNGNTPSPDARAHALPKRTLAFTRDWFTSKLYCGNISSFYCPPPTSFIVGIYHPFIALPPPATPTLLQYYCTPIAQYTPRHRPSLCIPYTIQYW